MALAGHHAANRDQRGGAETEFVRAEGGADEDISRKTQTAIDAKS